MENASRAQAYTVALRMLGRRALSVQELRDRLSRRGLDEGDVVAVLDRLLAERLLDDAAYARAYVHDRLAFHPVGRVGLKVELLRRGIDPETVAEVLSGVDDQAEEEVVRGLVRRRRRNGAAGPEEERRMRGWLLRRGFSPGVIRRVLGAPDSEAQPGSDG